MSRSESLDVSFNWAPKGQTPQLKGITHFRREPSTLVGLTIAGKIWFPSITL